MTKEEEKIYATQRIDALLDGRIGDLQDDIKNISIIFRDDIKEVSNSVKEIRKILIGNGREGVIQKVAKNSAKIKILCWLSSVIVGAIIGAYLKTAKINLSNFDPAVAQEIVKTLND